MSRMIFCQHLHKEAGGLTYVPYPGDLGQRIYENISAEAWALWQERLVTIMNENRLSTADPATLDVIEQHLLGFLFGEGDLGQLPEGFAPRGKK